MDNEGIDEILNGPADEPVIETPEAIEEAPVTTERPRGPDGKFLPKDTGEQPQPEAAAPEAAPPAADLPTVPVRALEDERRKRQELERRLQQMEHALQQPRQPPAPPVDFWEDPNTFLDGRLNEFGQTLIQQWEHRQQVNRVNQSEAAAKAKYPDFEEVAQEFVKQVQLNPSLVQAMAAADNPGEFVYQRGRQALELAQVGDLEAYKAKVIADYEAQLRASLPPSITAPTTTAGLRSVSGRAAPEWNGPAPLDDLIG